MIADTATRHAAVEAVLGHRFARADLLTEALTHRSAAQQGRGRNARRGTGSNERLEFVGDRVLGLIVAEWLVERFPAEQEGDLGPRQAHLVSRTVLTEIAEANQLSTALALAPHEARTGVGQLSNVLADAMEALIGALYLDGGLDPARSFVRRAWAGVMERQVVPPKDPKTRLQEWLMARGKALPVYEPMSAAGPAHSPVFVMRVAAGAHVGEGSGPTKRDAERAAAADLLGRLGL